MQKKCFFIVLATVIWFFSPIQTFATSFNPFPDSVDAVSSSAPANVDISDAKDPSQRSALVKALKLIGIHEYDKAIEEVKKVLKDNPDLASAHEILGIALVQKKDFDASQKAFQQAATLDPNRVSAITRAGDADMARGKNEQAKEIFEKALKTDPNNWILQERMGIALGDLQEGQCGTC